MAVAVPAAPQSIAPSPSELTTAGSQQMTFPVSAWIAQVQSGPAAIAEAVPSVPLTAAGGVAWP